MKAQDASTDNVPDNDCINIFHRIVAFLLVIVKIWLKEVW